MQKFSDRIMQFRQEARAVITELQKRHKNDFRIMEPISKSGDKYPDDDFKNKSIWLEIPYSDGKTIYGWVLAISKGGIDFVTSKGGRIRILPEDLSEESLAALADWILANHPIQKPGEDKV